ncbi:hypothetical protein BJV41_000750 [Clostridium beijerinckii]|nr:hypothetical protein [Clostridium beijerinckii]OOM35658.1 hypothetical protein CBEIJ_52560 [Clostridium beijerinckii]
MRSADIGVSCYNHRKEMNFKIQRVMNYFLLYLGDNLWKIKTI